MRGFGIGGRTADPGRGEAEEKAVGLARSLAMRVSSHELRSETRANVNLVVERRQGHRERDSHAQVVSQKVLVVAHAAPTASTREHLEQLFEHVGALLCLDLQVGERRAGCEELGAILGEALVDVGAAARQDGSSQLPSL